MWILLLAITGSGYALTSAEFADEAACVQAATVITKSIGKSPGWGGATWTCSPKASPPQKDGDK